MPTRLRHGRGVGFPSRIAGTCFSVHRQCSISHCAEPADRDLCARQRGVSRGSRGLSPSSASPRTCGVWPRGVCCLRPLKSLASLCGGRRNTAPGIARNRLDRAVTGNLLGLLAAIPANGEERPAPHHASVKAALSAAARVPPTRTPREPEFVDSGRFHGPQVRRKAHERAGKRSLNPLSNKTLDTDRADRSVQMRW